MPGSITHKDLKNKDYVAWRQFLADTENWTEAQVADHQLAELKRVVNLAWQHTIGYKKLWQNDGFSPDKLKKLSDIIKIPTVSKAKIQADPKSFTVPRKDHEYVTTGGSTGIPFGFYRDKPAFMKELASKAHQYSRIGWKEGVRQFVLRGLPIDTPSKTQFVPEFNELRASSYHLDSKHLPQIWKAWQEYQPEFLRCYPSSGHLFAKLLKKSKLQPKPLKGILCASENLYGHQQDLLQEVFQCRVFSHYGHYELATLAGFCEHAETYHVLPQYGYAELSDKNEIISTSFIMSATLFIRYRTQDFVTPAKSPCPHCHRPYQVWSKIDGRLQELAVTSDNRYIAMTAINMHDTTFDEVKQFQFYQDSPGRIEMRYIPFEDTDVDESQIAANLSPKLGPNMKLTFKEVSNIPLTKRGKHRFLIQKLTIPND